MTIGLMPGMSFAFIDDRAIVLDQARDRYFALSPAGSDSLRALIAGRAIDEPAMARLRATGLVGETHVALAAAPARVARASALETASGAAAHGCGLAHMLGAQATVRVSMRVLGLGAVLQRRRARVRRSMTDPDRAAAVARAYDRARAWLPAKRICLTESLALSSILVRQDIAHRLVFGVRLDPFRAHAWVEAGDLVLSDPVDTICGFTPILVE